MKLRWYVYYTFPKSEFVVKKEFEKANFEVFLPLRKVKRQWSDRVKIIDVPLFPNYIFIRSISEDIYNIIRHPKIIKYVAFEGRPASLKDEEILLMRKFTNNNNNIEIDLSVMIGNKVRIISGPLLGLTGTLIERKGSNRFGIKLHELSQTLSIEIKLENVELMEANEFCL